MRRIFPSFFRVWNQKFWKCLLTKVLLQVFFFVFFLHVLLWWDEEYSESKKFWIDFFKNVFKFFFNIILSKQIYINKMKNEDSLLRYKSYIYIYIYVCVCVCVCVCLVWFGLVWSYGTSTIVGYLMPNPFYTYKQFYFKKFNKYSFFLFTHS